MAAWTDTKQPQHIPKRARFGVGWVWIWKDDEARSAFSRVGEDEVYASVSQGEDSYVQSIQIQ